MVTIKRNEKTMISNDVVREEVVQAICDSFLCKSCYDIFRSKSEGCYRPMTRYVSVKGRGFVGEKKDVYGKLVEFSRGEMKKAFEILIENGYYMFQINENWCGYYCHTESVPKWRNSRRVTKFTDWD